MNAPAELRALLCEQWCAEADIQQDDGGLRVSLPLTEADGDMVTVWLQSTLGGWTLRDHGTTLMRLSYDMDVSLLDEGQRSRVVQRILAEQQVTLEDGELLSSAPEGHLTDALLRMGQAMQRLSDLRMWRRQQVASAFYDDLARELSRVVPSGRLHRNYLVPGLPEADSYPVDFAVPDAPRPLYIFGVPGVEKARLATIILQRLQAHGTPFESLIVPGDIDDLPKADRRRLMNAANDMVDSIHASDAIERKVLQRIRA